MSSLLLFKCGDHLSTSLLLILYKNNSKRIHCYIPPEKHMLKNKTLKSIQQEISDIEEHRGKM